jgi:hypothetical protein
VPSEEKIDRWCQMLSADDCAFSFGLGLQAGAKWEAHPPYPDLKLVSVVEPHVRRIVLQEAVLEVSDPETGDGAYLRMKRFVAELEGGQEMELNRVVEPVPDGSEPALPGNVCRACDLEIVDESEVVMYEGEPYHRRCMS